MDKINVWLEKDFGLGGAQNYTREQIIAARMCIEQFLSDDFGWAERDSLAKLFTKIANLKSSDEVTKWEDFKE